MTKRKIHRRTPEVSRAITAEIEAQINGDRLTLTEIAKKYGMTPSAVFSRRRKILAARVDAAYGQPMSYDDRKCLMCGMMFLSSGPGNRRCKPCWESFLHNNPI